MDRKQLIKAYLDFYKSKGHKEIANSSLIPVNNPTVLFTTAGMHPIIPYLLGQSHPLGKRLCDVQRCIRTQDIDDVGDTYHHTFFEMLGNWSLGDYFKSEAIEFSFEFFTKVLKIPLERFAVTCFVGDTTAPKDNEAAKTWERLGISKDRIAFLGKEDNWWETPGPGPCGPDTEMFYWKLNNKKPPKKFDPKDKNWVEIGNDVLMQYSKDDSGKYNEAKQKNIDFGGGVERIVSTLNGLEDNYLAPYFLPIIKQIEKLSEKKYNERDEVTKSMRIISDHIKAAVFIIADGVTPTNSEQGYVLRRLIRRAIRHGRNIGITHFTKDIAKSVFEIYDDYDVIKKNREKIIAELEKEEVRFLETLEKGIREFEKIIKNHTKIIPGKLAFLLYQSYGFPIEITVELAKENKIEVNLEEFNEELENHQKLSRTATEGRFKSGLGDNTEQTTRLHTATHLLEAALRKILGTEVSQKGSNITGERLRFDFSFNRKLTSEEIKKAEELVNFAIKNKFNVKREEMSPQEAKKSGALGFFEHKYGDIVSVYTIGNEKAPFSKEICTGPHVNNTSELGKFKIVKEEASSSGVRRIKAVLE
ncbi:MAG: alanine--tRNA ligase [Candidatus Pacearchaeota archaeon]|jgi:alanyl-tRNA synthetase